MAMATAHGKRKSGPVAGILRKGRRAVEGAAGYLDEQLGRVVGNPGVKLPIYSVSLTQVKQIPTVTHGFVGLGNARKEAVKVGSHFIAQVKDSNLKHVVYAIPSSSFTIADLNNVVRTVGGFRAHENPKTKLDLHLDRVMAGKHEVTFDVRDYSESEKQRIIDAAEQRGLHASSDGKFILVRDLRKSNPPGKDPFGLKKAATLSFRRSLFQRAMDGEALQAGESYIYLNGPNVEERKATKEDVDVVMTEVSKRRNPAVSAQQYGLAQAVLSGRSKGMPMKVARELVDQTSAADRSQFARELHENPATGHKAVKEFFGTTGKFFNVDKIFNMSADRAMREFSQETGKGYGVEHIDAREFTGKAGAASVYGLTYVNMGDSYTKTLLWDGKQFKLGAWGDWIEKYGRKSKENPQQQNPNYLVRLPGWQPLEIWNAEDEYEAKKRACVIWNLQPLSPKASKIRVEPLPAGGKWATEKNPSGPYSIIDYTGGQGGHSVMTGGDANQVRQFLSKHKNKIDKLTVWQAGKQTYPGLDAASWLSYNDYLRKGNPSDEAASMYEAFHGSPSEEVVEIVEDEHYHGNLAELGVLVEMKIETVSGYEAELGFDADQGEGKSNPGGQLDTAAARELELFTENDSQLYNSQEKPIQKNLILKMAKGIYQHHLAVKLYGYLMESGAKKYVKEHGSTGDKWFEMFSPATRKAAAERFADSFETEAKLGNYDQILPAKYQGWREKQNPRRNPADPTTADSVLLCSNEKGNQLYLEGGDQSLDLDAIHMSGDKWERDSMVIGIITEITYRTQKKFDKLKVIDYYHRLGEKTKEVPTLIYDTLNEKLSISGGQYFIKKPLVGMSPGIEN